MHALITPHTPLDNWKKALVAASLVFVLGGANGISLQADCDKVGRLVLSRATLKLRPTRWKLRGQGTFSLQPIVSEEDVDVAGITVEVDGHTFFGSEEALLKQRILYNRKGELRKIKLVDVDRNRLIIDLKRNKFKLKARRREIPESESGGADSLLLRFLDYSAEVQLQITSGTAGDGGKLKPAQSEIGLDDCGEL